MKPFFGFVNKFLVIVTGFIIVTMIICFLLLKSNDSTYIECTTPDPVFIDGGHFSELSQTQRDGRSLYLANCAAYHKLYKRATGPPLYGVLDKNFPSENYFNRFVTNEALLIDSDKVYADNLSEEYNSEFQHSFRLSEDELESLMDYLK